MSKGINLNMKEKTRETFTAYIFLLPVIIGWLIWFFYPALQSFLISFQEFNFITPEKNHYIGLGNYIELFKDTYFYLALGHSAVLVLVIVPIQTIAALLIALGLNSNIKGKGIFRTIYYLPYVISPVAVTTVFMYFFVQGTAVTKVFSLLGIENVTWFADMKLALPFLAIIYVWQMIGFYMVIYLSGLQTIPADLYEAANIDGANGLKKFRYITLPMLKPVTFLVLTYGMIQAFQMFDQVAAVARQGMLGSPAGATHTLVSFFYMNSFKYMNMGYGSAAAIVLFLLIFLVTLIQKKLVGSED